MVGCDYCEREFAVCVSTAFLAIMRVGKTLPEGSNWMLVKLGGNWGNKSWIREVRRIRISADMFQDLHIFYVHLNVRSNYEGV